MKTIRWLLIPFSLLYGGIVWVRNRLYDWGWLAQKGFNLPVIVVGNLEVGGTGKTPLTEYLIRLLSPTKNVATLSRGYGRTTKGFFEVTEESTAETTGDEPVQFKRKFPKVTVVVDEKRVRGMEQLLPRAPEVAILDDAFQHRALLPGFSILLFDYYRLNRPKFPLPTGDYRDCFTERKRANVLIVNKCPLDLSEGEKKIIRQRLQTKPDQPVYFASIVYDQPVAIRGSLANEEAEQTFLKDAKNVVLVTGIARTEPLLEYLNAHEMTFNHLRFSDHHQFTDSDMRQIVSKAMDLAGSDRHPLVLTTEKDAIRLDEPLYQPYISRIALYSLPIRLQFHGNDGEAFDRAIVDFTDRGASFQN